jgi:hypothetical protein
MFRKEFILDSATKLTLEHSKVGWTYLVHNQPVSYGNQALADAQLWVNNFAIRYPGYAAKMQGHYDNFVGESYL